MSVLRQATETQLGPIGILVNNAGIGIVRSRTGEIRAGLGSNDEHQSEERFLVSKAVVPSMISRKSGDIINISSLAGKSTFAGGGIYCATKWGLMGLTGCMAEDLRVYGIRVSAVCPGSVVTDFAGRGTKDASRCCGRRCSPRGDDGGFARAAEFHQRSAFEADCEGVVREAAKRVHAGMAIIVFRA